MEFLPELTIEIQTNHIEPNVEAFEGIYVIKIKPTLCYSKDCKE